MEIKETLISLMTEQAYKPMNIKELSKMFHINKSDIKEFTDLLSEMEKSGEIVKTRTQHYGIPEKMGLVIGKFQGHQRGFGFVIAEVERPDIFIPADNVNGAMNGDKVLAKILKEENKGKKCEGEITRIIERSNKTIIGTYDDSKNFGFVVADDKRIAQDIFIPKAERNGAKTGQIVIAEITEWPEQRRNPEGRIIEILGDKGDQGIDILTIIKKHKLPEEFPQKVEDFAANIVEEIPKEEYARRTDLRNLQMVTIDGEDAKDLDDAVSIEVLANGNYRLGVHIADVSNYVKEKNPLDIEALNRATSVYLIDRVIPMLPKKLSNGVCSLNPKLDRLALTCFMEIDKSGKTVDHEIVESVIKTNERMTYTDVTKILRDKDEETIKKYDYLYEDFKHMEDLCSILNKKRMGRGAIDFDFTECKIILNEFGKPVDIVPYERGTANRIIEEFMLIANETVAEHMFWLNVPFVYRIHEDPDEEKLIHFSEFAHNLGYAMKWGKEIHPRMLQEVIASVKGKKEEMVLSTLLLRSMMKAKYSPECVGHFGLASKYYCHFTSPIRRYPDLMIHRIIKEVINGGLSEKRTERLKKEVEIASKQSSDMERVAMEAEREVDDLKKAEYMNERIGQEFEGIISSVTNFGLFVELPNTVEGLVHMSSLDDDYYVFDERHLTLVGERTKKMYKLGEAVKIVVSKVDLASHEVYFDILKAEDEEEDNEEYTVKDLDELIKDDSTK
ncbi:ribonuclease R [Clostridium bowmanii]|uniref:ribonuclease R n=1 Tax=Clostridium bowmanii TaxID=132925 RepID=UPI001C0AD8CB|nr:ribonuclease R [Clostridium bowmanii]MBU3188719.1 ribonuclease R [Clostridium bowmanii]MCA1073304.1 ribonuclease R [Clostridium bowmanii]